jgi:hypothetical protein
MMTFTSQLLFVHAPGRKQYQLDTAWLGGVRSSLFYTGDPNVQNKIFD